MTWLEKWKLKRQLRRQRRERLQSENKFLESISKDIDAKQVDRLYSDWIEEAKRFDGAIHIIHHRLVVGSAEKYFLPIPKFTVESIHGSLILSYEELHDLRAEVRKERAETFDLYFKMISPLVGLVGALTGLFAVLLR